MERADGILLAQNADALSLNYENMPKSKKVSHETHALVIRETRLSDRQQTAIQAVTPPMFIREKPGRGGKKVKYVEAGYVVSRLNTTFSPAGWDFEIIEQGQTTRQNENNSEGEVWVKGKLTIIDHKNNFKVSKTQYGQHPIHKKVPIGDAFKAAASDCLKKCASMFGIAHDVYWGIGEIEGEQPATTEAVKKEKKTAITEDDMKKIKAIINSTRATDALMTIDEKISLSKIYTEKQKQEIRGIISRKIDEIDSRQA